MSQNYLPVPWVRDSWIDAAWLGGFGRERPEDRRPETFGPAVTIGSDSHSIPRFNSQVVTGPEYLYPLLCLLYPANYCLQNLTSTPTIK